MSEECYNLEYLQKYKDNPFIYERKCLNEENVISYKTIIQEAKKCIKCLQKLKLGNNVGIGIDLKEHSPASCVLLLGILNLNGYFFCLDIKECKDIDNCLRLSGVKYVISSSSCNKFYKFESQMEEILIFNEIFFLKTLKSTINNLTNVNLCYTISTSGSTGQPKMVHVPYDCILPNIKSLSSLLNVELGDIVFLGSPPTFDPFVVEFFLALMNGIGLLMTSNQMRLQPKKLHQILFPESNSTMKGVTLYQTTPSLFRLFGTETIGNILSKNTSLRCLILGGEEFPSFDELKTWLSLDSKRYEKRIFNIYGITEVSCWSSICELIPGECSNLEHLSIGKPMDDYTCLRIIDEVGNILIENACKGELEIGSSIRCCLVPEEDKNNTIIKSQEIIYRKTGDLVERDEFGHIFYLGRINNTVKRMGKRICLDSLNKKIEKLLKSKSISLKVVTLWLKESMKLIIYLVSTYAATLEQKQFVRNVLQEELENYEHPDEIIYNVGPLPLNKNGKIDRFKILAEVTENKLTTTPTAIFQNFLLNILGLNIDINENATTEHAKKRIKISVSFMEAGGTSFQALSLATEITKNLENGEDQRKILEMLLNTEVNINEILDYLGNCKSKAKHSACSKLLDKHFNNLKFTLKLMWRCDLGKCVDASPSVHKGVVAVGSHSHILLTTDSRSGEEISRIELPDRIECPVVFVTSQLAIVGCYDGVLYGFNYRQGSITWSVNIKGMIKAKPFVIKNLIIVGCYAEEYNVVAYNFQSSQLKWRIKFGTKGIFSSPVLISEKLLLMCGLDGSYGLIKIKSGFIKWQKKLDSPIFATSAKIETPAELLLVLAEVKGQVTICKAKNGEQVTTYQAEGNIFSSIISYKQNSRYLIIFGCHDKNVYCLDFDINAGNLCLIWKYFINAPVFSTPIKVSDRYILCCSTSGMVVLLDVYTAELMASFNLESEIFSSPTCLDNKFIYLGSRDNNLYAFELLQ